MNKKAFTLIETMMVSVVMVIILGILTTSLVQTRAIFQTVDITTALHEQAHNIFNKISSELKKTHPREIPAQTYQIDIYQNTPSPGTDTILFYLPDDSSPADGVPDVTGATLTWNSQFVTIGLDTEGNLVRTQAGNTTVLAGGVKRINFLDQQINPDFYSDELKVIIELEKTGAQNRVYDIISTGFIKMRN